MPVPHTWATSSWLHMGVCVCGGAGLSTAVSQEPSKASVCHLDHISPLCPQLSLWAIRCLEGPSGKSRAGVNTGLLAKTHIFSLDIFNEHLLHPRPNIRYGNVGGVRWRQKPCLQEMRWSRYQNFAARKKITSPWEGDRWDVTGWWCSSLSL